MFGRPRVLGRQIFHSFTLLLWFVVSPLLLAHGPFDNSALMIVHPDRLELSLTVGVDGARQILSSAGLSESETLAAIAPHGAGQAVGLPQEVAAKMFKISAAGKSLTAQSVSVMTDGLEVLFALEFPRPKAGALDVVAVYFQGHEQMRQGAFVAVDEMGRQLCLALLAPFTTTTQVNLPALDKSPESQAARADMTKTASVDTPPAAVQSPLTGGWRFPRVAAILLQFGRGTGPDLSGRSGGATAVLAAALVSVRPVRSGDRVLCGDVDQQLLVG